MENNLEQKPQPKLRTPQWLWLLCGALTTAVAVFFRFYDLTLKPLHHDEGVNGYFLINLFREGVYKYDPSNYHGPTLYYISLAFTKLFGLETFTVRASVGVFGVLMVVMALFLRRYIGTVGSISAAFLIAASPGMVYISRYFIHEIFFVFCSFGIVLGILFFLEDRKPGIVAVSLMTILLLVCFVPPVMNVGNLVGEERAAAVWLLRMGVLAIEAFLVFLVMRMFLNWNEGKPIYLLLAAAAAALFFATKETAFITVGTMVISAFSIFFWRRIYAGVFGGIKPNELEPLGLNWNVFLKRIHESNPWLLFLAAFLVFAYVGVLFFSSFFTYFGGVAGAFETYAFWTKTGSSDHTQNGFWAYTKWLIKMESPILILSAVGTVIAFVKARHIFAMFAGLWAFGLFAAYTIIPYKTPWLALSFILPMCLVAGYGINEIYSSRDRVLKAFVALVAIVAFGILGFQSYDLNFEKYDDDSMPYVYAHTTRGFHELIDKIEYYSQKSGKGRDVTIEIVSPDYWPMPWYVRDYPHANFHGKIVPANTAEFIIAKKTDQDAEVIKKYADHYKKAGEFPLRPGVDLVLLIRGDLADPTAETIYPALDEENRVDIQSESPSSPARDK